MLLEDATSREQVEAALEAGDDELREDIEEQLDQARRAWESRGHVYDSALVNMRDVVQDTEFIDLVILKSPTAYDLSRIPRVTVEEELRYAASHPTSRIPVEYGPFYIDDNGGDYFSFSLEVGGDYTFRGRLFPREADFIPSDIAKEFWASLGDRYNWDHTAYVSQNHDNYASGPGHTAYIEASQEDFAEWCRDQLSTYILGAIRWHPDKAKEIFFAGLAAEDSGLAKKLTEAELPDEEILDFAAAWFEGDDDKEEVLGTIRDYFGMLKDTGEPHEVVGEYTKADIVAMGIKQGVLFENAPWRLIKLRPADLRLEGIRMGHCVGEKGMGYIKALKDGEIEVWSLRSRDNKPRFTLEVDADFYRAEGMTRSVPGSDYLKSVAGEHRAAAIKQLKGKGNRTPGYADSHERGGVRFPDEVVFWVSALLRLGVDPRHVDDLPAYREFADPADLTARVMRNPGGLCTGFDAPYRPLRRNRRTSKRRGSKRRTSRRRSSKMGR